MDIFAGPRHWPRSDGRTKRRNSGPNIGTSSRIRRRIRAQPRRTSDHRELYFADFGGPAGKSPDSRPDVPDLNKFKSLPGPKNRTR